MTKEVELNGWKVMLEDKDAALIIAIQELTRTIRAIRSLRNG